MLIVPISETRPGMRLASPVIDPSQPDVDLLKRGYVLEESIIQRLPDHGITHVMVDYPGLDELDRHLAPQLSPERQAIYGHVKDIVLQSQGRTRPAVRFMDYYASIRELIMTLMAQGQHPVFMDQMSRMGTDAIAHATSVPTCHC